MRVASYPVTLWIRLNDYIDTELGTTDFYLRKTVQV
jgi:hypothetical protein